MRSLGWLFFRIFIVSCIALLALVFSQWILMFSIESLKWIEVLFLIVGFNLVSEGTFGLHSFLNRKQPWFYNFRKRLLLQVSISVTWALMVGISIFKLLENVVVYDEKPIKGFALILLMGFLFLSVISIFLITQDFFRDWRTQSRAYDRLHQQKMRMDYQSLQNQLNPHFLFNCLNILVAEIRFNPKGAISFTESLADMYRYVLNSNKRLSVSVKTELGFLEDFIYLMKARIGEGLHVDITIDEGLYDLELPPMTLQLLVENGLKHNICSVEAPLCIEIESCPEEKIRVRNNLQIKDQVASTGIGLENLQRRFEMISPHKVVVEQGDDFFQVTVPLLKE